MAALLFEAITDAMVFRLSMTVCCAYNLSEVMNAMLASRSDAMVIAMLISISLWRMDMFLISCSIDMRPADLARNAGHALCGDDRSNAILPASLAGGHALCPFRSASQLFLVASTTI
jgi:hypothetical protein